MVATTSLTLAGVAIATVPANALPSADYTLDCAATPPAYQSISLAGDNAPVTIQVVNCNYSWDRYWDASRADGSDTYLDGASYTYTITPVPGEYFEINGYMGTPMSRAPMYSLGFTNPAPAEPAYIEASATTIVEGETVTITPMNAPAESWVAWYVDGAFQAYEPTSSFLNTIAYEQQIFMDPSIDHTVTWVLYDTLPSESSLITDYNLGMVAVDWQRAAGLPVDGGAGAGQSSTAMNSSAATISSGQTVDISTANAPVSSWVAWFIDGMYVDGAPASSFPRNVAYNDFSFEDPTVNHTVTWALYETAPFFPSITDPNIGFTDVEWIVPTMAFTNSGSFTSGEAWSQEATFTQAGFDFSEGGDFALAGGAVLPEGITFTSGFAGGVPTLSFSGNASVYGDFTTDFVLSDVYGNSATATYSFTIAQSHTNSTDGDKICAMFPQAADNFSTATVTFETVCPNDATIGDASLTNTSDAYDTFGNVIGYNENGTEFLITSDNTVVEGNTITFTDYHVWSATAQEWVDVVVTRTFTGNTVTWDVQVFSTGTTDPSTLQISISGNLGSDDASVFTSFESGILGSNDGYYGDPQLLWNSYGATQEYTDGLDDIFFHYGTTGHAVLQNTLVDYESCPDVTAIETLTATVANDWEGYANTELPAATGVVCIAVTPADFSATVGVPMEVTLDITTASTYDFSGGAWDDAWDLPAGLSYTVVYDEVTGAPTQIVISGTPTADGAGSMSLEIWDDYGMDNTILIPFSIEAAAVTSSFEVNGATFQATVNSSSDLTPSNTVGFDFAEGGNIVVSGLPVGISYVVNNAGVAGVIPTVTLSGATETESDYTIVVTLTDNFGNEASMFPTVTVTAAPAPAPVTPTFTVGGDVAFMADVESDTTLTIVDDSGLDWTNGGTIVVTGLPAGLSYSVLNANTPGVKPSVRIYGTATTVGEYVISLTVTDSNDNTAEANSATEIIKASTSADLGLEVAVGGVVAGSESFYVADGLLVGANWTLTVRSTPQVIASGTVPVNGAIGGLATIPSGLEAGWHSLTLVSTDYAGNSVSKVVWFEISANGTLVATSNTEPSVLAYTGSNIALAAGGAFALLIAGAGVMLVARRRKVEAN